MSLSEKERMTGILEKILNRNVESWAINVATMKSEDFLEDKWQPQYP